MIDLLNNFHNLNRREIEKYAGVKFVIQECFADKCKRENHPLDRANQKTGNCTWYVDILTSDPVVFEKKGAFGRLEDVTLSVPIRYWNFLIACHKIIAKGAPLTELKLLEKAIEYAAQNCFEIGGKPVNMAKKMGFSSYSALFKSLK